MRLRMLDDVTAIEGRGVLLFSMDEDNAQHIVSGAALLDAQNHTHTVTAVSCQDGVYTLHIADGDAAYFERLFRNVRLDATLFTFDKKEQPPCP